jgi:hypothetical protein
MSMLAIDREAPWEAARPGTQRARARLSADHPVCRRPARQGAGEAKPVKVQRPAGRTILTGLAWSAGLVPRSKADGMIRLHPQPANTVGGTLAIIPEPECPGDSAELRCGYHCLVKVRVARVESSRR